MPLSVDRARESLEQIADHFDTSIREAALGMIRVVNSNMSNALKQVSIQRGHDPRDFVMVAAGGAGGLHASTLGRELGVNKIVIPRAPGQFSAWGMLMTDVRKDFIRTNVGEFSTETKDEINKSYNDMETEAISAFSDENIGPSEVYVERSADLRYEGQEHTVNTPISDNTDVSLDNDNSLSEAKLDETINSFHRLHKQNYNFELDDPIEVVNLRLIASHPVRKPSIETVDRNTSIQAALKNQREIIFEDQGSVNADVYERDLIPIDHQIEGPAVVEEAACTVLVHPDQHLRVDEIGNLIVQKQ